MTKIAPLPQIEIRVGCDTTVSVILDQGKAVTATIKTPREANPANGIISNESPLGSALLGKKSGDRFQYSVGNKLFSGQITKIHI